MTEVHVETQAQRERIRELENKIRVVGTTREEEMRRLEKELNACKNQANALRKEIQDITVQVERNEMISWNIIFRNVPARPIAEESQVRKTTTTVVKTDFSDEIRQSLKTTTFNIWKHDEAEMMQLIELMFYELELIDAFNIPPQNLKNFISTARDNYKKNPFHNFTHGFCVTQMVYAILCTADIVKRLPKLNLLIIIVSAICHDLDHPGFNNAFQINAQTELAIRYNDNSPLENHHASMAFQILTMPDCNIFVNIAPDVYRTVRAGLISCVLATDMGRHGDIFSRFKEKVNGTFNIDTDEDRNLLMQMLIKTADVSNEARPMLVSEPWVDFLLDEFFNQSDMEKELGLPVAPFMDREKVTKPQAQIGFIQFVLIPMFEAMAKIFPPLTDALVAPAKEAHAYYIKLKEKDDADKKIAAEQAALKEKERLAAAAAAAENPKPVLPNPTESAKAAPAVELGSSSSAKGSNISTDEGAGAKIRATSASNKVAPLRKNASEDNHVSNTFGGSGNAAPGANKDLQATSTASFPMAPAQAKRRSTMRHGAEPPKSSHDAVKTAEAKSKFCSMM